MRNVWRIRSGKMVSAVSVERSTDERCTLPSAERTIDIDILLNIYISMERTSTDAIMITSKVRIKLYALHFYSLYNVTNGLFVGYKFVGGVTSCPVAHLRTFCIRVCWGSCHPLVKCSTSPLVARLYSRTFQIWNYNLMLNYNKLWMFVN